MLKIAPSLLDLIICVVSWNRPELLEKTLISIYKQAEGLKYKAFLVDNGSNKQTLDVIKKFNLDKVVLLPKNIGINQAYEKILPRNESRYILTTDADMEYLLPFKIGVDFLDKYKEYPLVSYQHSPEHLENKSVVYNNNVFHIKTKERGCSYFIRNSYLQLQRPLPKDYVNYDFWIIRDSPNSLNKKNMEIGVLHGGARHLGYKSSMWKDFAEVSELAGIYHIEYPDIIGENDIILNKAIAEHDTRRKS